MLRKCSLKSSYKHNHRTHSTRLHLHDFIYMTSSTWLHLHVSSNITLNTLVQPNHFTTVTPGQTEREKVSSGNCCGRTSYRLDDLLVTQRTTSKQVSILTLASTNQQKFHTHAKYFCWHNTNTPVDITWIFLSVQYNYFNTSLSTLSRLASPRNSLLSSNGRGNDLQTTTTTTTTITTTTNRCLTVYISTHCQLPATIWHSYDLSHCYSTACERL